MLCTRGIVLRTKCSNAQEMLSTELTTENNHSSRLEGLLCTKCSQRISGINSFNPHSIPT